MLSNTLLVLLLLHFSYGQKDRFFFRRDYTYSQETEGFYKIHTLAQTWSHAKRVCAQEGASLFYPQNEDEAQVVLGYLNSTQNFEWVYIGISAVMSKGVFETVDGLPVSHVYHNWNSGEPNDLGNEDCVIMKHYGTLNDVNCDRKYPFICKKSLHDLQWNALCNMPNTDYTYAKEFGKCYKVHTTPMGWSYAYGVCSAEQSHLAMFKSKTEAEFLVELAQKAPRERLRGKYLRGIYHLGVQNRYNEGWRTVTGTLLKESDLDYQPDGEGNECGAMFYTGRFTPLDCDQKCFFICEHEVDTPLPDKE